MNLSKVHTCETSGITYYYSVDVLSENQKKLALLKTMDWALDGGYVGGNAGVFLNDVEAFDGDLEFTAQEIRRLMQCPIVQAKAKEVAKAGVPVYWVDVINCLGHEWIKTYVRARNLIKDRAQHCDADEHFRGYSGY